MNDKNGIVAIVVTYNPNLGILGDLLDRCAPQVDSVVLVDNSAGGAVAEWLARRNDDGITLLPLGENLGIAAAQNVGINWARSHDASWVLLFDQDSLPESDMVSQLVAVARDREDFGEKIGMVGPRFVDAHTPEQYHPPHFVRLTGGHFHRVAYPPECDVRVPVDFLIASGSLIPLRVFDEIGLMNESLFIDHVDTEFSFRLKKGGYKCYGVPGAVMHHAIGDTSRRAFGRNVPMHSPLRHYYIVRNAVWIVLQSWLPLQWKVALGTNTLRRFAFYALFASPRLQHLKMMLLGLWHGLRGHMGRFL